MNENISDEQQVNAMMALANLKRQVKVGANNFYWIAALSVVNSVISIFDGGVSFVIGLGFTQLIDGLAFWIAQDFPDANTLIRAIGIVMSIAVAGLFALFAYFGGKGHRWAFIVGMVLYGLDGVLLLAFQDWWGVGFHLFLLWGLFGGLQALKKLQSLLPKAPADSAFPSDLGYDA
ncbi:MAG: hypothetical protein B6I38_04565 [Anaerolineaceae bacterium 4572_5.1]|nr:MAG: hypothetical protein B6I38_04565 [Anaerolineaceae bacterium 4572_5.1]